VSNGGPLCAPPTADPQSLVIPSAPEGQARNLLFAPAMNLPFATGDAQVWSGHSCPLPLTLILI
jgi:hypothetical protein